MDIITLAAWGEFIGGIAVVVSLVYLASQIRQNSKLLEAAAEDSRLQSINSISAMLAGDSEIARIYWDGVEDREVLSKADQRRFDPILFMTYNAFVQQWQYKRRGQSTGMSWDQQLLTMRLLHQQVGVAQWWSEYRGSYIPVFREFVVGVIREGEAAA